MFFPLHQFLAEKEGKNVLLLVGTPFEEKKHHLYISSDFVFVLYTKCSQYFRCVVERCQTVQKKLFKLFGDRRIKISTYLCCYRCILPIFAYYVHFNRNSSLKITRLFFFFLYAKLQNDEKMRPNCDQRKSDKMPYINGSDSDSQSILEWILEPGSPHTTIIMSSTLLVVIQ